MSDHLKGILLSMFTVFQWAAFDVSSRYLLIHWDVDPTILLSYAVAIGGVVLILIAGRGQLGMETLRQPHTWAFSILQLVMDILFITALLYVSATEASFITRASIVVAVGLSWVVCGRAPRRADLLGSLFILAGCWLFVTQVDPQNRVMALSLLGVAAVMLSMKTIISELHPTSNQAESIKDRCRVTGYVLLVSALFFIGLSAVSAWLNAGGAGLAEAYPLVKAVLTGLPTWGDFVHMPAIWGALILGTLSCSLSMYSYFYAIRLAKTEKFMMVCAFMPAYVWIMEAAAAWFGLLEVPALTPVTMSGALLVLMGAMIMIFAPRPQPQPQIEQLEVGA